MIDNLECLNTIIIAVRWFQTWIWARTNNRNRMLQESQNKNHSWSNQKPKLSHTHSNWLSIIRFMLFHLVNRGPYVLFPTSRFILQLAQSQSSSKSTVRWMCLLLLKLDVSDRDQRTWRREKVMISPKELNIARKCIKFRLLSLCQTNSKNVAGWPFIDDESYSILSCTEILKGCV